MSQLTVSPADAPPDPFGAITVSTPSTRRRRRLVGPIAALMAVIVTAGAVWVEHERRDDDSRRHYLAAGGWPAHGEAAYRLGSEDVRVGPDQRAVPIASLAKVMTAYLVLRAHPLAGDEAGPSLRVTRADVADTAVRRSRDESLVAVRAGERLSERQALIALLLPSANNVAHMLARRFGGSVHAFVARMNTTAYRLGMRHTTYTDPSGFDEGTRSTAADQLRLARAVARMPAFMQLVALPSAVVPVAGTVTNTDSLLGHDGFVGTKTGSDDAADGCFMFVTYRVVRHRVVPMTGVVLGQPGHNLVDAGLYAARQLADRVAPAPAG